MRDRGGGINEPHTPSIRSPSYLKRKAPGARHQTEPSGSKQEWRTSCWRRSSRRRLRPLNRWCSRCVLHKWGCVWGVCAVMWEGNLSRLSPAGRNRHRAPPTRVARCVLDERRGDTMVPRSVDMAWVDALAGRAFVHTSNAPNPLPTPPTIIPPNPIPHSSSTRSAMPWRAWSCKRRRPRRGGSGRTATRRGCSGSRWVGFGGDTVTGFGWWFG